MRQISEHFSTLIRHMLSLLLLCGTVAGSLFTLSSGKLTLPASQEMLLSVGGVTAALEFGAFFSAVMLGELKRRARTAHTPKIRADYERQAGNLTRWLVLLVGTSAIANFSFRLQTEHSLLLALFFAAATSILLIMFCVVLQPLGVDYHAKARQSMQSAVVRMVTEAGNTVNSTMRDLSANRSVTPERLQMMHVALAILASYAPKDEQAAIQFATAGYTGSAGIVDAESDIYWQSADVQRLYGVSKRTAQLWISECPGRRPSGRSGAYECPRRAIESAHGQPQALISTVENGAISGLTPRRRRRRGMDPAQPYATAAQSGAPVTQTDAMSMPWYAPETPHLAYGE